MEQRTDTPPHVDHFPWNEQNGIAAKKKRKTRAVGNEEKGKKKRRFFVRQQFRRFPLFLPGTTGKKREKNLLKKKINNRRHFRRRTVGVVPKCVCFFLNHFFCQLVPLRRVPKSSLWRKGKKDGKGATFYRSIYKFRSILKRRNGFSGGKRNILRVTDVNIFLDSFSFLLIWWWWGKVAIDFFFHRRWHTHTHTQKKKFVTSIFLSLRKRIFVRKKKPFPFSLFFWW